MESALPVVVPPLAALIVVAMATVLAWTVATPLVRAAESPTLPERLLHWSGQHRFVAALTYAPLLLTGRHMVWALPLAWLGLQITSHRVRRTIYRDTWSFAGHVWWNARVFAAGPGVWLAVAAAPAVLLAADAPAPIVVAVGVALALWLFFYNDILCFVLGARPIDDPALREAFEPVLARAASRRPRLFRAGARGGTQINAFALGALRGDAVLFLDGLLAETTPAEAAAVLAHEIGHLEDFAARRWQTYAPPPLFVLGGVLLTLLVARTGAPDWIGAAWAVAVIGTVIGTLRRSQQRETASDRRAVELCGDGEALIRALVIIHERARVPRRFHPEFASQATHPSLARRIQAIRAIGGATAPAAPSAIEPRAFADPGSPGAVIFEAERVVFVRFDEPAADLADLAGLVLRARQVHALPYAELSSLHVEPRREDGAVLVAADRRGETRRIRLADADVAAVQALLDAVDARIGPPLASAQAARAGGRVLALLAVLASMALFAWGVLLAAFVALVRPSTPLLAATASGLIVAAGLEAGRTGASWLVAAVALTGGASAVAALRQARRDRADDRPFAWDGALLAGFLVSMAAAGVPSWILVALGDGDVERLHVVARALPSAAVGWALLGGLCLAVPRRLARLTAALAAACAVGIVGIGSDAFRDRFAPDPLLTAAPPLIVDDLAASTNGRLTAPGSHVDIRLAPDAQHVLLGGVTNEDGHRRRFTIAGFDGWQRRLEADDVRFVDGATILAARWEARTLRLWTEAIRTAGTRWSIRIDDASTTGVLDVEPSGRWRVELVPNGDRHDARVRLEGRIDGVDVARAESPAGNGLDLPASLGAAPSGTGIQARREFTGRYPRMVWLLPSLMQELTSRSVLERTRGAAREVVARSRLGAECLGLSLTTSTATCLARTGDETIVWNIDADAGPARPVTTFTGMFATSGHADRAITLWRDGELLLMWRGTNRAVRFARGNGDARPPHDATYAAGHLVTLTANGDRDEVVRYPLTSPTPTR